MATELQLADVLSEFARTMVTDFPIQGILDRLVERIVEIMPISAAGVTLISGGVSRPYYLAASSETALKFERLQTVLKEGPCLAAYRTDAAVSVPDLAAGGRFERFAPMAMEAGLRAVFAFPLRHGTHDALGALDLYRDTAGPLDTDAMYMAQTLADVAAAYILNAQARQDLKEVADRFEERSLHDSLTGLPNRVLFGQLVEHAATRTERSGKQIAMLFADLDRFKAVNDLHGHQVGDELLIAVAQRLAGMMRPSDTLARLAGDEFVILCEDLDDAAQVERLAERIDAGINRPFVLSGHVLHMTASIGIAYSGPGHDVPGRLLRDADTAMYQAKRKGGDRHQILDLREQEQTDHHKTLSQDLRGVLERNEVHSHYQPIVTTDDGCLVGVEALLRWVHPERGTVPPALVVPLAEESRLICEIGRHMLSQASLDRQRWLATGAVDDLFEIAVNVSTHELLAYDYASMVESVLAETGTDAKRVTLEITESVLIKDPQRALVVLNDLKGLGVRLALDDFGTGFSSLGYLHDFPVDIVKIDQSFVASLGQDPIGDAIVASIVDLARTVGMHVVAEGVETSDQYHRVRAMGCEACQGFYFAKALPVAEIDRVMERHRGQGSIRFPVPAVVLS